MPFISDSEYKPTILKKFSDKVYVDVLLELKLCAECRKPMFPNTKDNLPGPNFFRLTLAAQGKLAGWPEKSSSRNSENERICSTCEAAGRAKILCALCKKLWPSDSYEECIGYPAEYLCKYCYMTVSAKVWNGMVTKLEAEHRWDGD